MVNVVFGVPLDSVLCQVLFLLYTSELVSILENKLIGYSEDSTLIAVSECCDLRGMKRPE